MRSAAASLLSLALLAGCGSDDDSRPPLFGGFAPQDATAVLFAPATCDIPFVGTAAVTAVAVGLTSTADACALLTATEFCGTAPSSTGVIALALAGQVGGGTIAPAGPGSYPFLAEPPTGAFRAATADAARVDAECVATEGGAPDASGGRMELTAVGAESVAGSMSFRFDDGTSFDHTFDVSVCPVSVSLCSLFQFCFDHVCVAP